MTATKPRQPSGLLTVIKWELRSRRWSIIWWIIGIALFVSINISVYPTFRDQSAQLNESLNQLPESMRQMFSDTGDFMSPVGFLSSQVFYLMLPLLFCFLTIGLGSSLIAREEQRKTIELLLARPISRGKLLLGKALSGLTISAIISTVVGIICMIEVAAIGFDGVSIMGVFLATMMAMLFGLLFGAIAFMLTGMGAFGRGASIAVASLLALGGYVISSLEVTVKWLQGPSKLLPYHYFKPGKILEGHFPVAVAAVFVVVILAAILVAWISFRRRDIE